MSHSFWFKRWYRRAHVRPRGRHARYYSPVLDVLEDRTLPSASNLFGPAIISSSGSASPVVAIAAGDLTGDKMQDLITLNHAASATDTFSVLLGDGQGHFTPAPNSPVSLGIPNQLPDGAVDDFNGDNKTDLAVLEQADPPAVDIWLGDGKSGFTRAPGSPIALTSPGSGEFPLAMMAGHFHRGGPLDLVVASEGDVNSIRLLTGNGDGTFTVGPPIRVDGTPASLAVGYFNNDNNLDLAVANKEGRVDVFLGNGQGGFQKTLYNLPSGMTVEPHGLVVGSFSSDGKSDLVMTGEYQSGNVSQGAIDVLLGDGQGNFSVQPVQNVAFPFGSYGVVGDFDGDGTPDLFVIPGAANPEVLLGNGNGGFSDGGSITPELGGLYLSEAAADFTGSGKLSIAVVNNFTGNIDLIPPASPAAQAATSTQLVSSQNPSVAGQTVTFTATVTPTSENSLMPTGTVTFTTVGPTVTQVQTVPLGSNGQASVTLPFLAGPYSISATYNGDSNFTASTSSVLTQTVRASATFTWSGAGADNRWSDGANWVGGVAPAPGDRPVFPSDAAQQTNVNDYPAGSLFASLLFTAGKSALARGHYLISGNGITLGAGGVSDKADHSSNEIAVPITLAGPAGFIALQNSADTLQLDGPVSDVPAAPTAGLVKSGAGDLVLSGGNTYAGATLITRGQVDVENGNALGTGVAVVRAGATLRLVQPAANPIPLAVANPLVLAGTLATGSLAGPASWTGSIILNGPAPSFAPGGTTDASSTLIVRATITGVTGLAMQGAGTLVLGGNNVYTGATTVRAGIIDVTNPAGLGAAVSGAAVMSGAMLAVSGGINVAVNVALAASARLGSLGGDNSWSGIVTLPGGKEGTIEVDAGQLTITGVVTEFSVKRLAAGLRKTGIGTLVLPGVNTFTGGVDVADGVLVAQNTAAVGRGNIQVGDGGTLALDPVVQKMGQVFVFTQRLTLTGSGFENQGALELLNQNVTWSGPVQLNDVACIATTGSSVLNLSGTISGDTLMVAGTGDVQLSGSNTYAGATLVLGGDLDVLNAQALPATSEGVTAAAQSALRLFANPSSFLPLTLLDQSQLVAMVGSSWNGPVTYTGTAQVVLAPRAKLELGGFLTGTSGARLEESGGGALILAFFGQTTFATVLGPNGFAGNQIQVDSGLLSLTFPIPHPSTASLQVSLAAGFTPALGQQFTLIHNLTASAIIGTFAGLPEGGTITVDGFTFQITYKGGAGNDVVMTRVA